ncbi:unnamed protein product [Cladocopium goreaui]|uniref:Prolyl 4-hydroxylase alpha subunit Fe(2+) 2OG dioxygenase domain-containing protein n=1 Tax=Cladocopium goreaui TaxID=2562237 RepID=A0A9P1DHZ7_9DINO|nr:unnamed protein product [Cladocopium goreaui]
MGDSLPKDGSLDFAFSLAERIQSALREALATPPLHLRGALLRRVQLPAVSGPQQLMPSHDSFAAHADRATVAAYHYSAVLYLSERGDDFQDGELVFMDSDGHDRCLEPRAGRLVGFSSGLENLHRVAASTVPLHAFALWAASTVPLHAFALRVFRLLADFLHLAGMSFGLAAILSSRSVAGFSRKTQVLFQVVFVSRYLDIFTQHQGLYLLFFKITFNLITAFMLWLFHKLHHSYEASADSCNLLALVVPPAIIALFSGGMGVREEAWTFSELLEPLALIPQYIVCYRATKVRPAAVIYVLAVGGYRTLYVCNWIYKVG